MEIIFTICSNNYLAHAKNLSKSLKIFNPRLQLLIGLVDTKLNDSYYKDLNIVPIEEVIDKKLLSQLSRRYYITELCTSVKPFYIKYLFDKYNADIVIYFDPDIVIYNSLNKLVQLLNNFNIIVTPHFCTPPEDNKNPTDLAILGTGVYNLGFIAMHSSAETINFVLWWQKKLITHCFQYGGMFTDQLWVNFVTCFVEKVLVLRDPGYNVANWNLHERSIILKDEIYYINNKYLLVFFHFSNYNIKIPNNLASYNNRFLLENRLDVKPLFDKFAADLKNYDVNLYKLIKPQLGRKPRNIIHKFIFKYTEKIFKFFLKIIN